MKQKFRKLSFVHICKDMPEYMSHFESDFDGIVNGTYAQLCSGKDVGQYDVYEIKDGRVVNSHAWYDEDQLTLLPKQDRDMAEEMIENYLLGNNKKKFKYQ